MLVVNFAQIVEIIRAKQKICLAGHIFVRCVGYRLIVTTMQV